MKMLDLADHLSIPSDKHPYRLLCVAITKFWPGRSPIVPRRLTGKTKQSNDVLCEVLVYAKQSRDGARVGQYFYGLLTDQNPNSSALCSLLTSYFILFIFLFSASFIFLSIFFLFLPSFLCKWQEHTLCKVRGHDWMVVFEHETFLCILCKFKCLNSTGYIVLSEIQYDASAFYLDIHNHKS